MIEFRLGPTDLCRTRFAYSPLAELAAGLHALSSGAVHPLHRPWLHLSRADLRPDDVALLRAVVPPKPQLAEFLYGSLSGRSTTIEGQLDAVARLPVDELRADLLRVWEPAPLPPLLEEALAEGRSGSRRIADALHACWSATIGPHWPRLRTVLDGDVAYRAERLTNGGSEALLADLHPQVRLAGNVVRIDKRFDHRRDLTGQGLILVPSMFTWPRVIVAGEEPNQPSLTYAARGIASAWEDDETAAADDPLTALIGRTRATILRLLDAPHSPTQLASRLDQSPSSASQHLTVLRRSGLATARRQGRRVLYLRTPLADSLLASGVDSVHRSA